MKKHKTIGIALLFLCAIAHGQREYNYSLQLQSDTNNSVESTIHTSSSLGRLYLSADTLLINADSLYGNRSIEFQIDGSISDDVFIGLSNEKGIHRLGFRILESKAYLSINDYVLQGPFQGELHDGSPVTINNILHDITSCKLLCSGNEISFFINDALVHKSCLPFDSIALFHQVTAQADIDITIELTLQEW